MEKQLAQPTEWQRLDDLMPKWWIPPYGTELTLDDFEEQTGTDDSNGFRTFSTRLVDADGTSSEYVVKIDADMIAWLTKDSVHVRSDRTDDFFAGATERNLAWYWIDWVMREDATTRLAARHRAASWEGDSVDAQLERVSRGIVQRLRLRRDLTTFFYPADLQRLLDQVCALSPSKITVYRMGDMAVPEDGQDFWESAVRLESYSSAHGGAGSIKYLAATAVHTSIGTDLFYEGIEEATGHDPYVMLDLQIDGSGVSSDFAQGVVYWEDIKPLLLPTAQEPQPLPIVRQGWWVLHMDGAEHAIAFPICGSALDIAVDCDGSDLSITVLPSDTAMDEYLRRELFNRRWGRWLDLDAPLSQRELNDEVRRVTARLLALMDEEDEDAERS